MSDEHIPTATSSLGQSADGIVKRVTDVFREEPVLVVILLIVGATLYAVSKAPTDTNAIVSGGIGLAALLAVMIIARRRVR